MREPDKYFRVVYTDPLFDVPAERFFTRDERLACQEFVGKLQAEGCKDVRVERLS